ncbi:MAG TPA: response regulator [Ktedonobacterales bacterium]|nr:response regulator [Ktedonobacterales bacterium]
MEKAKVVLIVEDDEDIREVIAISLGAEGFDVRLASNGQQALEEVERETPDVILLDMLMPVMSGWEFKNRYFLRPGPYAPIIVLTAAPDAARRAAEVNANDFIAKPFDLKKVTEIVRRYANLPHGGGTPPTPAP